MLFGEYLKGKGYCTEADVQRALELQEKGDKRLIGRILLDNEIVTWEQIEEAIIATAARPE